MKKYSVSTLKQPVLFIDGAPITIPNREGKAMVGFNVAEGFIRALNGIYPDEQPMQGQGGVSFDIKMRRYEISKKIHRILGADTDAILELSTEEQSELKECVKKFFKEPEALGFFNEVMEGEKA